MLKSINEHNCSANFRCSHWQRQVQYRKLMDGAVDAPPPLGAMATLPTVRASLIFHLCDYEALSDMFLPTFLCRKQEESPSASAALSPQRKSERDRTHSMKGSALIASTSPRPPMSVKERVDAHRNRDTL